MMIAQINHDMNYLVENGPVQPLPRYHDYEGRQVLFVPYSIDAPTLHELIVHTLAGEYVLFSYDGYVIQLKREKDTGKETLRILWDRCEFAPIFHDYVKICALRIVKGKVYWLEVVALDLMDTWREFYEKALRDLPPLPEYYVEEIQARIEQEAA